MHKIKTKLIDVAIYILMGVFYIFSILPRFVINFLGDCLGSILFYVMKSRTRVAMVNLTLCFGHMSESDKRKFVLKHYREFTRAMLDYGLMFFANEKKLRKIVSVKQGQEVIDKYINKEKVILLAPHFAGLDIGANFFSIDYVGCSMYSEQKNKTIDKLIINARTRFMRDKGGKIFPRTAGIKTIIRAMLQEGSLFYYLPDQDIGDKQRIFVPFFDHPNCPTIDALPKLAKLTRALVIPMMTKREKDGSYGVYVYSPLENYPTDDVVSDVAKMNKVVEKLVLDNPYQYFWLHKRFKNQPDLPTNSYYK